LGGQVPVLVRHCSDARTVWNLALEQSRLRLPGRRPTSAERFRQLAEARRGTWLGEGSSSVQQAALRDFDRALQNWWAGTHRRPTWRKAGVNEGFVIRDLRVRQINRRWGLVTVPKAGRLRFRLTVPWRQIAGCSSARLTLDRAGRWHVSFIAPQPTLLRAVTGAVVGVDLGVVHTLTTSDGHQDSVPGLTAGERQRLRRLERREARQRKGSNRRERTRVSIARLHARNADRRRDWVEKLSTQLVLENDLIVLEDLQVRGMIASARGTVERPGVNVRQKAGLNRSISEQGWSMLRRRIEDKAATCGVEVVAVSPRHTSQTCNACGHVAAGSRESQARFRCVACGHQTNADINAAKNILAAGLAVTARGRTPRSNGPEETRTELAAIA